MRTYKRIGLMDHMGFGNMGDAAIQESFIANIGRRLPGVHLVAFSLYPDDTAKRHGIFSYPLRWSHPTSADSGAQCRGPSLKRRLKWLFKRLRPAYALAKPLYDAMREGRFLIRSYRIVKSLDLLVMSGGGQLCELYGRLPYNVFKFCVLAKLSGTPVFFVGVGADLLIRRSNKFFAKWSVRLADRVSFRSVESQALIRALGVKKETDVVPDPAYGLAVKSYVTSERAEILSASEAQSLFRNVDSHHQQRVMSPQVSRRNGAHSKGSAGTVGLNPIGFCDPRRWPRKDGALYSHYLKKLTAFSCWLLEHDYRVEIFTSDISGDIDAMQDLETAIMSSLSSPRQCELAVLAKLTLKELLTQIATFDYVVTSRFHGVIFSHLLAKPVIALSYLPKIDDLMRTSGHGQYCLEIEHFDGSTLTDRFAAMVAEENHLRIRFQEISKAYSETLDAHFDELFLPKMQ